MQSGVPHRQLELCRCVGFAGRHRLGCVQSGVPCLWSHSNCLHQRVHDDLPASVQLSVASQAHGVHLVSDMERTDGQCQVASLLARSVVNYHRNVESGL